MIEHEVSETYSKEWLRATARSLSLGGMWGVPRSGLVYKKTGDDELTLHETMPWAEGMPVTSEQLAEQQATDHETIKTVAAEAGISVEG